MHGDAPAFSAWSKGRLGAAAMLLLAAVAIAYSDTLGAPFQFDDWWAVAGDARVQSLSAWWQSLPGIRPLLKLSYTLNGLLSAEPAGFRLANIAVHAANGLLLWALLRQWLPRLAPAAPAEACALAMALLFVLHPAATEAVTYISGRSVSLMATFYLLALWLLGKARDASRPRRWRLAATLAFAVALAVRETAVTLPLAWLLLACCTGQPWRDALRALAGPLAVLALAAAAALLTPGYHSFFGWSLQTRDLWPQLLGQLEAHLYLLTHPLPGLVLNIDPDVRVPGHFAARHALLLLAAAAAMLFAWTQRRTRPWLLFALGWYLLHLAPSNSLLPRFDLANDRHLYLALPGVLMVLVLALAAIRPRPVGIALGVGILLAAGLQTMLRNHDYRSEQALWEATIAHSPAKARPWTNLGYARQLDGDPTGAAAAYRCALALDPAHRQAAWNLAVLAPGPSIPGADDCRP